MNSYTVSLPDFEYYAEIAWFSSFDIHDLNQEQPMSSSSSVEFCCFSNSIFWFSNCVSRDLLEIHVIIALKWGIHNGNHMNDDVAEVNGSVVPVLPGSFLHEKEPGFEAS